MIQFHSVSKKFGNYTVLDNLNLNVEKGKITFIVGKSGEGKSVTIKHIIGLMKPTSGRIFVDGSEVTEMDPKQLRIHRFKFGMLFQNAALFDSMTAQENILFPLNENTDLTWAEKKQRVYEVLSQVGLPDAHNKFPGQLSTGERKRIGLARALAAKPKIILYDEPTTGMDPLVSEMIDELIVKVGKEVKGITSVVISHDLKAAMATADKIIMLYKGRCVLAGTPADFAATNDAVVKQFFSGNVEGPMEFL
ncbi:MAG: ATP-binding cassette domain-containing protein [Pseudomonadota bacterium]